MSFAIVYLTSLADLTIVYSTRTDADGQFQFFVPPGRYSLSASDFNLSRPFQLGAPIWDGASATIEIKAGQFATAELQMRDVNPKTKLPSAATLKTPHARSRIF